MIVCDFKSMNCWKNEGNEKIIKGMMGAIGSTWCDELEECPEKNESKMAEGRRPGKTRLMKWKKGLKVKK